MPTSEQSAAIRQLMRDAAASGNPISYHDAQRQSQKPDLEKENTAKLFAEIAELKKELAKVKSDLNGMRITGKGFSGIGPTGIQYNAPSDLGQSTPMEIITITFCDEDKVTVTRQVYAVPE